MRYVSAPPKDPMPPINYINSATLIWSMLVDGAPGQENLLFLFRSKIINDNGNLLHRGKYTAANYELSIVNDHRCDQKLIWLLAEYSLMAFSRKITV